jgi:hypothetical protein
MFWCEIRSSRVENVVAPVYYGDLRVGRAHRCGGGPARRHGPYEMGGPARRHGPYDILARSVGKTFGRAI